LAGPMNLVRSFVIAASFGVAALGVFSLPACGSSDTHNKDYGQPPDAQIFNPGLGGSDGYGYPQSTPFVCPDELKRCSHTFTYPFAGETSVELRGDFGGPDTWLSGKAMTHSGTSWTVDAPVPYGGAVQYKFFVDGKDWKIDPAQPTVTDANDNTNNTFAGTKCDPAICEEEGALPPGVFDWRDSVIYFAFVDRFNNSGAVPDCDVSGVSGGTKSIANYMGGDWPGVTAKINDGYFTDLGINTIWLTVPFDNPSVAGLGVGGDTHQYSGYHGYWPKLDSSDPTALASESCFGTFADLKALVSAAHAKGLKVLFDYAMVHVHSSSGIFAAHSDWFWPNDNGKGGNCICGEGCSWDTIPEREHCWFTSYLPHWNYTNSVARDYSVTNAIEWIKQTADASGNGVDGFRADAIKHVDISWLTQLRAKVKSDVLAKQTPQQRFYMVGETYDFGNRDLIKGYVDPATKLDGQFDFPLRAQLVSNVIMRLGSMTDLSNFMNTNDYYYGANAVMSTFVGNHDLPRIIHLAANSRIWGDNQGADGKDRAWVNQPGPVGELEAYERVANAFAVLFTNRGAPLVYYGDEIGMPGAGDPDNRRMMTFTGLSPNQTFLHDRVKKLGEIRSKHPALRRGTRTTLEANGDVWAYSRVTTGDAVYVAVNRSDADKSVGSLPSGALTELVTGAAANGPSATIPARQTRIFVAK
jgi:glycosidase